MMRDRWNGSDVGRCTEHCYHRDEYRVSRGHGFRMHYSRERCVRPALPGKEKCWQHDPDEAMARILRAHETRMRKRARLRAREEARR